MARLLFVCLLVPLLTYSLPIHSPPFTSTSFYLFQLQPFLAQAEKEKLEYEAARRLYEEGTVGFETTISFGNTPSPSPGPPGFSSGFGIGIGGMGQTGTTFVIGHPSLSPAVGGGMGSAAESEPEIESEGSSTDEGEVVMGSRAARRL